MINDNIISTNLGNNQSFTAQAKIIQEEVEKIEGNIAKAKAKKSEHELQNAAQADHDAAAKAAEELKKSLQ